VDDYSKLLGDMELTDVTFAVDGQRFPAHRCVLAVRSPYFRALFKSGNRTTHDARTCTLMPNKSVTLSASACQVSLH